MITVVCNLLDVASVSWSAAPLGGRPGASQIPLASPPPPVAHGIHYVEVVGTTLGANVGAIGAALDDTRTSRMLLLS
ncbi:hypothetical protein [Microbacterium aurum]